MRPAFVCGHAAAAYADGIQQAFFWTDAEADEPCGWCADCQERYIAAGEEWQGDAESRLDAKLVCSDCFREMIKFNGYH